MIPRPNNFAIVPCIIVSIILHGAVFFIIGKNNKQESFIQVPFEVSFYSPAAKSLKGIPANKPEPKKKQDAVKKAEPAVINKSEKKQAPQKVKSDIVTKATEKEDKKKKVQEQKQEISETESEEDQSKKAKTEQATEEPADTKTEKKEDATASSSPAGAVYSQGMTLENKNFKYSYYASAIYKKIKRYWQDSNINVLRTVVYFKIDRSGNISKLKISKSSKNSVFDKNALRAVELASPFPPLPDGYLEDSLGVYFEFKTKE